MEDILLRKTDKYTLGVKFKKMQFAYTCRQSGKNQGDWALYANQCTVNHLNVLVKQDAG
jgi:hypothetical protein